jgi:hypothetical protein
MYDANVAAMLPTGHVWPYATGFLGWAVHHELVATFVPEAEDAYLWFADRQLGRETTIDPPEWTSAALGDEAIILRSGWEEDDSWLGLKGRTAPCPSTHCQEDQMSLMLVDHGAWLLIDPGDGRSYRGSGEDWKEAWLQSAQGHNNVLVDGEGPGMTPTLDDLVDPAELSLWFLSDRADYGRMDGTIGGGLAWGGTDHTRRVWLVDDAFYLVVDQLEAASSALFAQQFHLGGSTSSPDGTLSLIGPDFLWDTENDDAEAVHLEVIQAAPRGTITLDFDTDGGTNFRYPETWDHTYVRAHQSGTTANYMTLLLTGTPTAPAPIAEVLVAEPLLRLMSVEADEGGAIEVTWNGTGFRESPGLADSDGVLSGTDGSSWAFMAEGTAIIVNDDLGAMSTCELDALQLQLDESDLMAQFSRLEDTPCSIEIMWTGGPPSSVEIDDIEISDWTYDPTTGTVMIALRGLTLRLSRSAR